MNRNFFLALALISTILAGASIYEFRYNREVDKRNQAVHDIITEMTERAYFYGQRDVLSGDVRITFGSDSSWHWTKSPWLDSTHKVIFNPTKEDNKKYK